MKVITDPPYGHDDVEVLDREVLHQGYMNFARYQLRFRLYAGGWSASIRRELLERYPVAGLLPYDPRRDEVVLIEQFRVGAVADPQSPWLMEIVAGVLEDEQESLSKLAKRETKEEAGLDVDVVREICDYWVSPGGSNERVKLFCGKVDASHASGFHGLKAEHEDIKVHVVKAKDAFAAVESGRINNAATIIALQWLALHHTEVQQEMTYLEPGSR